MVETLHVVETLHTRNTSQMQKCTNHLSTALDAGKSHTWWVRGELEDQAKNWDQTTKKGNWLRTVKFQTVVSKDVTHGGCMEPAELTQGLFKSSIWSELFQIQKHAVKVLHLICQQIWKTRQWPGKRTGKSKFSFQSQRKAMPKNAQTTTQLHSSHTLVK